MHSITVLALNATKQLHARTLGLKNPFIVAMAILESGNVLLWVG